jgi:pimeloyl-ACP methyl ester carboxylesterase
MNPTRTTTTITTSHFPQLAYRRIGKGPALMLLHGFPASGVVWDPLIPKLSEANTLLIPDIPGAGDSKQGKEDVTIELLSSIVPAILDHEGIGSCVLAGHSMGGYIALAASEQYADRIDGLALVHSTAMADDEEKKEKRRKSISLIRKGGREEFVKGMIPGLFSDSYRENHPEGIKAMLDEGLRLPAESMIAFYNAMIERPDRRHVLEAAGYPIQWILGRNDTTIPWQSCLQQTTLSRVSFVELYANCAHMSMIEQPEELTRNLLLFSVYCMQRAEAPLI